MEGKRYLMTYTGTERLLKNTSVRKASSVVDRAFQRLQGQKLPRKGGCAKCQRGRLMRQIIDNLRNTLKHTDQMEIERIKSILGVKHLVFSSVGRQARELIR